MQQLVRTNEGVRVFRVSGDKHLCINGNKHTYFDVKDLEDVVGQKSGATPQEYKSLILLALSGNIL